MTLQNDTFNHIWFPFTCSQDHADHPPRIITHGEGMYLFDSDGKRYMDAVGSWWVSILGHCHPRINAALKRQVDALEQVMMAGFVSQPALELSQVLSSILPLQLSRIFYSDDGSTAVEVALKIALQYWANKKENRTRFVALGGGYHGDTLGAMSVGCIPSYHSLFHERFKGQLFTDSPYCYRCPCNKEKETCNAECMDSLKRILDEHGNDIAACIFEPMVQGAGGMRMYPAKVITKIAELCESHGVLTIADEVAVGFGRTGRMFACEHAGFVPDLMCLAKGLTGGYIPMAVTAVREEIYDAFSGDYASGREFAHGHSFTGNPLAAAVACETQKILIERNVPASLDDMCEWFDACLMRFMCLESIGDVRRIGMIGAIELVADRTTKRQFAPQLRIPWHIAWRALENGVLIRPLGNVLYFVPAYIVTKQEISEMTDVVYHAIKEITKGID